MKVNSRRTQNVRILIVLLLASSLSSHASPGLNPTMFTIPLNHAHSTVFSFAMDSGQRVVVPMQTVFSMPTMITMPTNNGQLTGPIASFHQSMSFTTTGNLVTLTQGVNPNQSGTVNLVLPTVPAIEPAQPAKRGKPPMPLKKISQPNNFVYQSPPVTTTVKPTTLAREKKSRKSSAAAVPAVPAIPADPVRSSPSDAKPGKPSRPVIAAKPAVPAVPAKPAKPAP